ncbi:MULTISPECIES: sensor histidine kinase [unclassified Rathayibacter]|uniref:sensor histidine kinase n=1 Tax=unclassified Rathayibacter TaxID=2609250 RepID=UPI0006FB3A7D|nr:MULTISPECIES: ATP-binding protein [unclassified Rathayibacter]KQQ05476.1 hypothetical protein ASF42_02535 [Rathayibacter sp. Leaf294]KQS13339.1 hypothetical protein ASG06_02545 [Rathayibacter sp. Leaf185]
MPAPRTLGRSSQDVLRREQSDVGIVCARLAGGVFTAASALHLLTLDPAGLLAALPVLLLLSVAAVVLLVGRRSGPGGGVAVIVGTALGVAGLAASLAPGVDGRIPAVIGGVTMIASMAIPSALFAIGTARRLPVIALAGVVPTLAFALAATWESGRAFFVALSVVVCWAVLTAAARWLAASVERAHVGTARLRTAHAAERRSSESEARRRYDARLLHDTILGTLTLVAHRGEGVAADTVQAQAAADLGLLRRLGRPGAEEVRPVDSDPVPLPAAFAALERRFEAVGLEIAWHTTRAVGPADDALAASALDALVRATGECLENVRRHSGVLAVDVTVAEDPETVRVAVSDAGRGFSPDEVPAGRLGLAESVVARLEAVGGDVRVFSAPGAGTTVLMSVPR